MRFFKALTTSIFLLIFYSVTAQSSSYVYNEEFYSQGSWTKGNDNERELYVSNGKYYFEHKRKESYREFTTRTFYLNKTRDFEIETSILKISGEQDFGMSFLFDYKDSNDYTEFGITSTGYYRVAESNSGTYSTIKGWTSSSAVKKGNYATNKLKIKKKGNRLTYYINGTYVYGMDFKSFKGSKMGFRLWRDQKVAIDYFRVKYTNSTTVTKNTTSSGSKTILFEGFNNNNNKWSVVNDAKVRLAVVGGDYIVNHKRSTGGWSSTISKYINSSRNFRITAQIKKVNGILNNGYGVTFGKKNNDNQTHFLISGDGSYKIVKWENGTRSFIKNWTKSSYIKQGNGKYNYLKVQKAGSAYKFYINSKLVHTSYSVKLYGDRIGFTVYDNQEIAVGYLSMMYEDNDTTTTNNNNKNLYTNKHTTKESILFDGYTDNRNDWAITKNNNVNLDIRGGNYYFDHKRAKGGWSSTTTKYIDTSRDFKILADIKKETGILNNGYGIIFGRLNSDNQNLFYVNGNGSYSINKVKDGRDNFKKRWVSSSAIRKGNGAYNVLKVVKIGTKLEYYINNTKVYTDFNPEFFGNRLGYIIYDRQKISIAYLSVGYLDKKSNTNNTVVTNFSRDNVTKKYYSDSSFDFSDQFNNNNNQWVTSNNNNVAFKVSDGKYRMVHKRKEKGWSSYINKYIDTKRDFELETKIDKIAGVTNHGYGLMFGKNGSSDFRFYIASSGYYKIARMVNGKEEVIKKWTTSSFVTKGNQKSNTLKIKKEGDYLKFYVNNNYLDRIDFEPFFGNDLGYVVYNNQEIAVDYLRLKYINKNNNIVTYKKLVTPVYEDFSSNKNGWVVESVEKYSTKLTGGNFIIDRKQSGGIFISKELDIDTSKDFIIKTSIARDKSGGNGMYGITFGRKNSGNEYSFLLHTNSTYTYRKFEDNKFKSIISSTRSDAIKSDLNAKNEIKIVKTGSKLRFYVNNNYLNETDFEPFFGNKIGYTVYHSQRIKVDYLDVNYNTDSFNEPPVVVITEPNVELKRGFSIVKAKRITVKGKATDKDGIFEVRINGTDAYLKEDGSFTANVPLKIGSNELVVTAKDIKQATSTKTFVIKRKSPDIIKDDDVVVVDNDDVKGENFGNYYALFIGVSDYNNEDIPDLAGAPIDDANNLAEVLISNYGFKKENITLLTNSPKKNEILRAFYTLRKKVKETDNVLIFYAGHGNWNEEEERGWWMPSDYDPEFELNGISNNEVVQQIELFKSRHTLLISDACFSGGVFKETRSGQTLSKSIKNKLKIRSRRAITSGNLKEVPNESVFLRYLVKRLKENETKYLAAGRLFMQIEEPVANNTENTPRYGPIFGAGDEGGDFIFVKN